MSLEIRSSSRYLRRLEGEWEEEHKDRLRFKTQPDSPGYIYFLRTMAGWYKYGRCTNWDKHNRMRVPRPGDKKLSYRKDDYTGANTPGRNRSVFNRRQVILMSAEDIGMMGLSLREYQLEKRAQFEFKGTTDQLGRVTALLIFNNRGLYVQGKHMSVVRLKHE